MSGYEKVYLPITAVFALPKMFMLTTAVSYTRQHSQPVTLIAMFQYRFVMWPSYSYYHTAYGSK